MFTNWAIIPCHLVPQVQPCVLGQAGFASSRGHSMEASFRAGKKANSQVAAAAAAAGGAEPAPSAPAAAAAPAKKASKPRLPALDSLRFFLIAYIAVGHFVAFATRDPFLLKLLTQVRGPVECCCGNVGVLCGCGWEMEADRNP